MRLRTKEYEAYLFILPAFSMLIVILGFPFVMAILMSLNLAWVKSSLLGFTFENYSRLFRDRVFYNDLIVTLSFVLPTVGFHLLLGLGVALLLNMEIKARRFFRVVAILPWTIPDVIAGLIWRFMFDPLSGIINSVLARLNLIQSPITWLSDARLALPSVVFAEVWRGYPFVMLLLLAGLQSIPQGLYEAAKIDGASAWKRFWHISLPNLSRIIMIAFTLDFIWECRRFGLVYNMTGGNPGHATEVLSLYVYKNFFIFFNFGYAAAIAVVLALIMMIISFPYLKASMKEL